MKKKPKRKTTACIRAYAYFSEGRLVAADTNRAAAEFWRKHPSGLDVKEVTISWEEKA